MGEALVFCDNAAPRASKEANALRLKLSGRDANIVLKVEDIGRRMIANIPDVLTDLLEVATYVYCADQLIARGGDSMQALGTDWRRKLRFIVPVREPRLLPRRELRSLVPVSDMTIWRWERDRQFPRHRSINGRNYWRLSEVWDWIGRQQRAGGDGSLDRPGQ